jgi:hypothetical protein
MNDERAAAGLDHLQTAALEMISAARAFLDVAEDLVSDREKVADVVAVFGDVADAASRAARGEAPRGGRSARRSNGADGADDEPAPSVQHIRVL